MEIKGLTRVYGERTVLDIESLSLESGRRYALIGPNGSGKSTLLRIMAGTLEVSDGFIDVSGDVARDDVVVGYMPQSSYVFDFSVRKNVAMALEGSGLSKDEQEKRVEEALREVGMHELAEARGSGLSGGEAQRVALARILARDLDVVLLDEPTASMDVEGTMQVEEALVQYCERTGCLLVVATHAPSQARRIADEAIMLSDGHIAEFDEVTRVLENPQSEEGRSFLSYWSV